MTLGTDATGTAESAGTRSAFAGLGRIAALPAIGGVGSCGAPPAQAKSEAAHEASARRAATIPREGDDMSEEYPRGGPAQSGL